MIAERLDACTVSSSLRAEHFFENRSCDTANLPQRVPPLSAQSVSLIKDCRDSPLLGERRERNTDTFEVLPRNPLPSTTVNMTA
jgi:hypothetical protein